MFPTFDLMREHALLDRILRIYESVCRNPFLTGKQKKHFIKIVNIVSTFIENYHEPMEEKYIFPHFPRKDTIKHLIKQHKKSKKMTKHILESINDPDELTSSLHKYIQMYREHEIIENTEVFEYYYHNVPREKQAKIYEIFEKTEDEKFGRHALTKFIEAVIEAEKKLTH